MSLVMVKRYLDTIRHKLSECNSVACRIFKTPGKLPYLWPFDFSSSLRLNALAYKTLVLLLHSAYINFGWLPIESMSLNRN